MEGKRILVVDDEPDAVAYLRVILEDNSYEVVSAHNAEKGMELLEKNPPDLILADVMMPGASGLDFILRVRRNAACSKLPIIVITGKAEVLEDRCRSYLERFGVSPPDEVVEKPFDPEALLETIDSLLKKVN